VEEQEREELRERHQVSFAHLIGLFYSRSRSLFLMQWVSFTGILGAPETAVGARDRRGGVQEGTARDGAYTRAARAARARGVFFSIFF